MNYNTSSTATQRALVSTAYAEMSLPMWKGLVHLAKAENDNTERAASGRAPWGISGNGRNRTTAALVKRGLVIATPRENATQGSRENLALSAFGWAVVLFGAEIVRAPQPGCLSLEDALAEAYPVVHQNAFPGCLTLEEALAEAARMDGWNFTGLRGYRPEDMGTDADPAARPGIRVRIRPDAKTAYAGRTGTVSLHNRGIVNNPGHPNHGLPYVTVGLDPAGSVSWVSDTRQFVSDLEMEDANPPAAPAPRPSDRITLRSTVHGSFQVSAESLDRLMDRYLPASPAQLRKIIAERSEVDYSDLTTITECLMVLGELDGLATN